MLWGVVGDGGGGEGGDEGAGRICVTKLVASFSTQYNQTLVYFSKQAIIIVQAIKHERASKEAGCKRTIFLLT